MKKKLFSLFLFIGIIAIVTACGEKDVEPVAINEKTDTCATCNMAVIDNQYATQLILENGKSLVFDDIGCMNKWMEEHADEKIDATFVRDYHTQQWVLFDEATYVYNQAIKTPMAYNVISFQEKGDAETFVAEHKGSTLLAANDLTQHSWEKNQDMMMKNKNMNHSHSEDGMEQSKEEMNGHNESNEK